MPGVSQDGDERSDATLPDKAAPNGNRAKPTLGSKEAVVHHLSVIAYRSKPTLRLKQRETAPQQLIAGGLDKSVHFL
jgi:hypothetical protein